MAEGTTERRHTWAWVAGGVLTAACVTIAVATQWDKLPDDIRWHFAPGWLALSIVLMLVFHVVNGEIWRGLLRELGGDLRPPRARAIWATTMLARYVPTGALTVVARAALAARHGVPRAVCIASSVYELIIALASGVILSTYFVIVLPDLEGEPVRFGVLLVAAASLTVLHPRVFERLSAFPLQKLGREPLPRILPAGVVARFLAAYIASMLLAGLSAYAFARSLHGVPADEMPAVLASFAVGFSVALVAFVLPGGIGAREAGMAAALSGALPLVVALAVAVGTRLVQIGVELLYAAIASALSGRGAEPAPAGDG